MIDVDEQIKKMMKDHLVRDNNLLLTQKMFVAKSILLWINEKIKNQNEIKYYLSEIEKHLKGEITLYWQSGIIKVRKEPMG